MSLIYRRSIAVLDKFVPPKLQPLWNHEAGPKTIFFWAPIVKWGLVVAGIGDLSRPVETLSVSQSGSLAATGVIWARYSLVIIPKNWSLFSVNMFVAGTNLFQFFRAVKYQRSLKESN
ncbi:Brain protein, putative [Pediculus humanus corporis]|uniref:Mitochondrial pyruvate carrier n=1 Tax=Pediculus humanus subsp. corporis TaxID=121224 RepID=E0VNI9_PEDHC|nr:Brain protein, putative [Pediculus humanus corporis]EEB14945.1 Brain protein, putative [Pediculus humanus corporis]